MEPREIALWHARGRIAIGAAFVLLPGLAGRTWIGDAARRRAVKVFARALGARDVSLGLGVVIALDRGAPVRGWLEAGALADTVDLVATMLAGASIPAGARSGVMAVAAGSSALGGWLSRQLEQPQPPDAVEAPEATLTGHPARHDSAT